MKAAYFLPCSSNPVKLFCPSTDRTSNTRSPPQLPQTICIKARMSFNICNSFKVIFQGINWQDYQYPNPVCILQAGSIITMMTATHPQQHTDPGLHSSRCFPVGSQPAFTTQKNADDSTHWIDKFSTAVNYVSNLEEILFSCCNLFHTHPPLCHM